MKVLVACEFSEIVKKAFLDRGHDAYSVDLLPGEMGLKSHYQGDIKEVDLTGIDLLIAHPPCNDLAVSGARWFKEKRKDGRQQRAIEFFLFFVNAPVPRIVIENPIGIMSTIFRKPDQIIQPWQFGHPETKATCLWYIGNIPYLKPTKIVKGREGRVWKESPGPERWKNRSRTYQGIADAMADQWGKEN